MDAARAVSAATRAQLMLAERQLNRPFTLPASMRVDRCLVAVETMRPIRVAIP